MRATAPILSALVVLAAVARADDLSGPKRRDSPQEQAEPTCDLLVTLAPGVEPLGLARSRGLAVKARLKSDVKSYLLCAGSPDRAPLRLLELRSSPGVVSVFLNERTRYAKAAFTPNDPYFHKNTPVAGFPGQWYLVNEHFGGPDAGLAGAWKQDITGQGVTIGIVDDGLEWLHPDLGPNYVAADSWDFGNNDANPAPYYVADNHGTCCAGVAAARGGNGIGVTGSAPLAKLAGLRVDFPYQTTQMFVDATRYHSTGANRNIQVKSHSYGYGDVYIPTPAETAAVADSAAAGTIHVVAATNSRGTRAQDSNKLDMQNEAGVICVASLASSGIYADYSNFGACIACTAPSSSRRPGEFAVTTVDSVGIYGYNSDVGSGDGDPFPDIHYTSMFGGTSSATPTVAGILAGTKQLFPALDVRSAKHLLARTCRMVDAADTSFHSDGGWRWNGGGVAFNQNYGFGLVDATALANLARETQGVSPLVTGNTGLVLVSEWIPDGDAYGVVRRVSASGFAQPCEEVQLSLHVSHAYRGDVVAHVTSPSGYTSRMMIQSLSDSGYGITWTFTSNAFWGEDINGIWTIRVADLTPPDMGVWDGYSLAIRTGRLIPTVPRKPAKLALTSATASRVSLKWKDKSLVEQGFRIYRRLKGAAGWGTPLAEAGANATAYTDRTVSSGTKLEYKVTAFNSTGESGESNILAISVP